MNFYVGQRVVCVNDKPGWITGKRLLTKWCAYEIRSVLSNGDIEVSGVFGYWDVSRFQPTVSVESEAFAENLITQLETEVETLEWLHK